MTNRITSPKAQIRKIPSLKENFGLSKPEFEAFIINVKSGDENLFLTIFNEHFQSSVIYLQNKFSISKDIAYDVCMDTMLDFRSKLIHDRIQYGNLRYLFTRMAINNFIDGVKRKKKVNEAISVFVEKNIDSNFDKDDFFETLKKSIDLLDDQAQHFISELYFCDKPPTQVAEENNISYATLRKRKQRIIERLKVSFFNQIKNV